MPASRSRARTTPSMAPGRVSKVRTRRKPARRKRASLAGARLRWVQEREGLWWPGLAAGDKTESTVGEVTPCQRESDSLVTPRREVSRLTGPRADFVHNQRRWKVTTDVARKLWLELRSIQVRGFDDLASVFDATVKGRAGALLVIGDPMLFNYRSQIGRLASRKRLSAVSGHSIISGRRHWPRGHIILGGAHGPRGLFAGSTPAVSR
jgi:hypothetical protein